MLSSPEQWDCMNLSLSHHITMLIDCQLMEMMPTEKSTHHGFHFVLQLAQKSKRKSQKQIFFVIQINIALMEDQCLPGFAMLKCNLRLCEMRAGACFYSSARAQRGCARNAGQAAPRVKVLGHAIDNRRISNTFQWQSPVDSAAYDLVCDFGPSRLTS